MFYWEAGSQSLLKKYDGGTHLMQKPVFLPNFRRFSLAESEFFLAIRVDLCKNEDVIRRVCVF
jgi:hypothetical protein